MTRSGVLVMGFGGPDSLEAVAPFMCNLMGREPSPELVERVCARYEAIGGSSPLNRIAAEYAAALEAELGRPARVGMRYWQPYIAEGLDELHSLGADTILTVSLSPFESRVAQGAYREALETAMQDLDIAETIEAPQLAQLPVFAELHAEALADALAGATGRALVVFSAHSLPESDLVKDDPYVSGLRDTADSVAAILGWSGGVPDGGSVGGVRGYGDTGAAQPWLVAYQSKGQRPGAWLGPDLDEVLRAAPGDGFDSVVVSPIGFATDHMETLYDLDIVAADAARAAGIAFARAAVPNAHPRLIAGIAESIRAYLR